MSRTTLSFALTASLFGVGLTFVTAASAAEIKVLATVTVTEALRELGPRFERATSHKVLVVVEETARVTRRIEKGDYFDVAILPARSIANLTKKGIIQEGTGAGIARSEIGLAMRAGAARPAIDTPEAFRQTMLNATSVAYKVKSSSGNAFEAIMKRLEIVEPMAPKLRIVDSGRVAVLVANGKAEFAVQLIPELLPVAGIELVGPFPHALQRKTGPLTAAVATGARQSAEAKAFIGFLTEPASLKALMATGLQAP